MTRKIKESKAMKKRKGDGGIYLVVAEDNREFDVALRHACNRAHINRGRLGIIYIIDSNEFSHWGKVEKMMKNEIRTEAEKFLWTAAKKTNELNGVVPLFYIAEGGRVDEIITIIDEDDDIEALVLAGNADGGTSGKLVSYFSGKGLPRLRVPLVIVPGHLDDDGIDELSS